jgi:hypothetical protein
MITPDNRHYRQVQLLVRVLPTVAREQCFALKGGTAGTTILYIASLL